MIEASQHSAAGSQVYVVDDDPAVLEVVMSQIRFAGYPVEGFGTATRFLQAKADHIGGSRAPVCLVTDIDMPGISGLQLQAQFADRPHVAVVVMSGVATTRDVVGAFKGGATDVLLKPFDGDQLIAAVATALAKASTTAVAHLAAAEWSALVKGLTRRQREVVVRVVQGMRNREIAEDLGIALRTVKLHRNKAMAQLGVTRVVELVHHVEQYGELQTPAAPIASRG